MLRSPQMRRTHFVFLLILALVFSAVQCLASCAAESCGSTVPPCHQHSTPHHETSNACSHDFLIADAHGSSPIRTIAIGPVADSFVTEIWVTADFSPPELSPSSPSILRI